MEYEELIKLGKEIESAMGDKHCTNSEFFHLYEQRAALIELKKRIDNRREADTIAMEQDGRNS